MRAAVSDPGLAVAGLVDEWVPFAGRTLADAYPTAAGGFHLPRYPCYRAGESLAGDFGYFYLRGPRYLSCQAARFLLVGGSLTTLVDEHSVDLRSDLPGYWNGFYREHFADQAGELIRYRGNCGYREAVLGAPHRRVVAPHPFDSAYIPADRYYLDRPGLIVQLNDKGRMRDLTLRVAPFRCYEPEAFRAGVWRSRWRLPFVVKLTEASGGGDGVRICRTETDLHEAQERFAGRRVKVERYLADARNNYNVQLAVAPGGEIRYLGASSQRLDDQTRYGGNLIDLEWRPGPEVRRVCQEIARAAWDLGWHGLCGLDLIETGDGEIYFIDPNFRVNGSTPFFFLGDYLATHHRHPQMLTGYFCYPGRPEELFQRFSREIERKILAPVGAHFDPTEDGITRIYAALVSDGDAERLPALQDLFEKKSLMPGIGL